MRLLVAAFAAALACGGGTKPLTDADVSAIQQILTSALGPACRSLPGAHAPFTSLGVVADCPESGHATASGTLFGACDESYACEGLLVLGLAFGNGVDHMDDCVFASGLVVSGRLVVSMTGQDGALSGTLRGTLEANRGGPTEGIELLDDCAVSLSARLPQRTLAGSLCGRAVEVAW